MQGVCKAQPCAPLTRLLPSSLLEARIGHPPEVTDSFQQLDSPEELEFWCLLRETSTNTASYRAPVRWLCQKEGDWLTRLPKN